MELTSSNVFAIIGIVLLIEATLIVPVILWDFATGPNITGLSTKEKKFPWWANMLLVLSGLSCVWLTAIAGYVWGFEVGLTTCISASLLSIVCRSCLLFNHVDKNVYGSGVGYETYFDLNEGSMTTGLMDK